MLQNAPLKAMRSCLQMSRFVDIKDFGEAGQYLRLTNLEHLAAKAQAFDGTTYTTGNRVIQCHCHKLTHQ